MKMNKSTLKVIGISAAVAAGVLYLYNTNDTVNDALGGGWF
ncbi:hypothetical protein RED65_01410 [Oceanobacter sp. RED65]|uniref:Uncharacterized protein n=1 Tax=Bermanella marisrubri TaxID=207949 RepID=Q1N4Q2_9GAMM|nr:hypothetical protein RED65_01410 [Oceanobacter sp. RED65] [Bermanella marisrubri]